MQTALQQTIQPRRPTPSVAPKPADGLGALDRLGAVMSLKREQTFIHSGEPAECYFKVITGAVRSCKFLADGRRHVGDFYLPGDFIGLDASDTYLFTAEAITDTVVARYSRRGVDTLAWQEPQVGRHLLQLARKTLRAAQHQMLLLSRKTAEERIATFVLDMADRNGGNDNVVLPMTRTDIGDHLGLTMETVSRALAQLKKEGIIDLKTSHDITILDRDALEGLAEAN